MPEFNSGVMPGTDLRYEDFEGFLASFVLTLGCLEKSGRTSDTDDFATIVQILNGFAERFGVQPPQQALRNPRSRKGLAKPQEFSNQELVQMINSFGQDFGVGRIYAGRQYDLDAAERLRLGHLIFEIFDRYGLADLVYVNQGGIRQPVRIKKWTFEENRHKTLAESVREWKTWRA